VGGIVDRTLSLATNSAATSADPLTVGGALLDAALTNHVDIVTDRAGECRDSGVR
jgi:hypothetical protein